MREKQFLTPKQMNMLNEVGFSTSYSARFGEDTNGNPYPFAEFIYDDSMSYKYPCYTLGDLIVPLLQGIRWNDNLYVLKFTNGNADIYENDIVICSYPMEDTDFMIDICYDALVYIYSNSYYR